VPGPARWRLVELDADGSPGPVHRVAGDVTELGRRGRDVAEPNDEQMADHHASLVYESGEWFIADSGEGSGVWFRIKAGEGYPLESGDQIWLGAQLLVADRQRDHWTLAHYGPDGQLRNTHAIGEGGVFVGRGSDNELSCDDGLLSRRHAQFCIRDGELQVFDRGARNGTFVKVSGATALEDGSVFRIASKSYRLELSKE
jgi:pSer/pThr/pTyr-binding forkhead associated (FHA) protein